MAVPMTTATAVPNPPSRKMLRVPTMMRLRMSRPNWSAPKGWLSVGVASRRSALCFS